MITILHIINRLVVWCNEQRKTIKEDELHPINVSIAGYPGSKVLSFHITMGGQSPVTLTEHEDQE